MLGDCFFIPCWIVWRLDWLWWGAGGVEGCRCCGREREFFFFFFFG